MYSVMPTRSSGVFVPVAATSTASLHTTTPMPSQPFDRRHSPFIDESVDFITEKLPPCVAATSPARSANGCSDYVVVSSRTLAAERSTPLKPAKRHRTANDDDRQILRCKRSLATSLKTAAISHDHGRTQQPPLPTTTGGESVERRNLRERRRVKLINTTFATLRSRLPSYCWQQQQQRRQHQQQQRKDLRQRYDNSDAPGHSKRASKVDTLRTAISYIRCLQDLLADDDRQRMCTFQTFDAAAPDRIVTDHHWPTSPHTAAGHDSCSPVTSSSSSSSEDLTAVTVALTSSRVNNNPVFTDDILDCDVTTSQMPDIFDWLI